MSTLHDLRETLARHAGGLEDTGRHDRATAVRRRARVVRRRRTAATAVAAAFAVVGGVAGVATFQAPQKPEVAGPNVVGVPVPEEIAIHGFPYDFAGTDSIEDGGVWLELDSSEEPRAVSLVANGLGSGSATLYLGDTAVARVFEGDEVGYPVPLPASEGAPAPLLRVELHDASTDARTGVAIYEATGELAPGLSHGGVVFRERIAGDRLVAATFNAEGKGRTATVSFGQFPEGWATIAGFCRSDEPGLWFTVEDGTGSTSSGMCGDHDGLDARGSSATIRYEPMSKHTLTAYVTRGRDGPVVEDADVQLGAAAYLAGDSRLVDGIRVDEVVEHAGRTWRLDPQLLMDTNPEAVATLEADTDLLLGFVAEGKGVRATWEGEFTEGSPGRIYVDSRHGVIDSGPGVFVDGLLLRGDTYDVTLLAEGGPVDGALLVYRPE
ncbi:hypothetical protein [Nocardioides sp.]|uniref:hypothetical protein n=1 Tax=Nocardioides sp. TaxID=35761 RepID=UPI002CCCF1EB|nr:hypothetical protein [Nocardioides sp.]HXH76979.1 hypothetical protein [Nocardioides sp.]